MIKIFFSLVCVLSAITIAQQNNFNKEYELQKFVERGGKYEETSPNIYKLTFPDGISRVYNFNLRDRLSENLEGVDTTIINVWEIDTTIYSDKFTFWQKVEVANSWWAPLPVEDLNRNNKPELYGYTDFHELPYPSGGPVRIFERDDNGIYKSIFEYDSSTIFVKALGDIHRTGGKEIYMHSKLVNNGVVYRSDSSGVLPTTFDFTFYYTPNQINDMTFGDFDYNNITDCAFIDASNPSSIVIGEYRNSSNNFTTLFQFVTEGDEPSGFAIADFDKNGKVKLVSSTGNANIILIESTGVNQYALINQFSFPYFNAYMQMVTNDIDGNGKPEFWIGGQDFVEGITLYQCYEAIADNTYQIVARIELRYLVAFNTHYIQAVDIDNDGKQEIVISSGNNIFILKFDGKPGKHNYKIFYVKLGEATQPIAEFYPCAIADLNGDGKKDILIPFRKYQEPITYAFSYILRQDTITNVESMYQQNQENFITSYPTPFNSTSNINFHIDQTISVRIKIFNSIGKEINTLLENELPQGKYYLTWEGKDKYGRSLPSGVYYIVLQTDHFIKTTKTILLK
jgi:hypothetical protein